ncbi:3',5'-cyclic-nucleotide phosphodiesterase PDE2 SCDLUD_003348 [Saccharomycodes ludwigii]|uniref:3',5'-cyclic-nucleotide phosphodiesterase PDE2 n=1 Tax=Saccharomycodes ludwigii TaxID=36035 RepID=UPI001E829E56|nr:hypothetical protein SCDLUD_003348 [Saccharomycodes ludwigii]KAH3900373.1 hypothetical protein SCDLUD_003348 [Saccharomycodes ludwigii]
MPNNNNNAMHLYHVSGASTANNFFQIQRIIEKYFENNKSENNISTETLPFLKHFNNIVDLVTFIYKKRLENDLSYEKHTTLIIYDVDQPKGNDTETNDLNSLNFHDFKLLFDNFFGVLQFSVVQYHSILDNNYQLLNDFIHSDLSIYKPILSNRLNRIDHWCYTKDTKNSYGCTNCIYSMYNHLLKSMEISNDTTPASLKLQKIYQLIYTNINFKEVLLNLFFNKTRNSTNLLNDLTSKVNTWDFNALAYTLKELVVISYILLADVMSSNGLLSDNGNSSNRLLGFIFITESLYHQGNKFHNFKHGVDVLQATYWLCKCLNNFITPIDKLLVCISAIGHDVGHPGTNNMLLNDKICPISKEFYHNNSVLENFHSEIYIKLINISQVLNNKNLLSQLESDDLIQKIILATDMAKHGDFVKYIDCSQKETNSSILKELIIKAADISNVTRPLCVSVKWGVLIVYEFNECNKLKENNDNKDIKTTQLDENKRQKREDYDTEFIMPSSVEECVQKYPGLPAGQLFFINTFALELFEKLSDKFENELHFLLENILSNKRYWESRT